MILGAALVLSALVLLLHNRLEARQADNAVAETLPQLLEQMQQVHETETAGDIELVAPEPSGSSPARYSITMPAVEVDGYEYIGVLIIPSLELELPVMAEWDYDRLKIAPCRYSGSLPAENLVIAGHNYDGHFGSLLQLAEGETVDFVDMNSVRHRFIVDAIETLPPTAIDDMTAGAYPLTLFTCTYGGQDRVAVRCVPDTE